MLAKPVLLVFLATANSGGLAQLFPIPVQQLAILQPSSPVAPSPTGSGTYPPQGYACGDFSSAYSPWCLRFGLDVPHTPTGGVGGIELLGGEETGAAAAGEFPKLPPRVSLSLSLSLSFFFFFHFFFLRNSSCSILLLHTREGLTFHRDHLSS